MRVHCFLSTATVFSEESTTFITFILLHPMNTYGHSIIALKMIHSPDKLKKEEKKLVAMVISNAGHKN